MFVLAAFDWSMIWNIGLVAIGLGAVIFVHELGHFLVAKACGVQCDKFYVGFDIPLKFGPIKLPSTLWKCQWGETEYGIGILPLGGYVKMLGQDDNPAKISEEMQRAADEAQGESETKEITGPSGEKYAVHPRSYLAKSVPQRMAIISAGVVMNIIFAFVFAVIAFGVGVPYMPCVVSSTAPGSSAWRANLRAGDEIVQVGDKKNPTFLDLKGGVTLGDLENGVPLVIQQPNSASQRTINLKPRQRQGKGLATIGVALPWSLKLMKLSPTDPFSPAGHARLVLGDDSANLSSETTDYGDDKTASGLAGGDEVIAINGQTVESWQEMASLLSVQQDKPIEVTVRRGGKAPKGNPFGTGTGGREMTFVVEARPMKRLGLVMEIGQVVAVQRDSPAEANSEGVDAQAGVLPEDFLLEMNDEPIGDPVSWPDRVRQLAENKEWVTLKVKRTVEAGEDVIVTIDNIMPRVPNWIEAGANRDAPMSCPALGVAYRVLNRVDRVLPNSPAEKAGLRSGDAVVAAKIIKGEDDTRDFSGYLENEIEFSEEAQNWPMFIELIQALSPETEIELTVMRSEEQRTVKLRPSILVTSEEQPAQFRVARGFNFMPLQRIREAATFGEQIQMGYDKTVDSLLLVYRFLGKIGGQVPIRALGGPITIAKASYYSANEGFGKLLVFLTILSANLAVINFLPIPILDGGHMVFLAFEGIAGRPPREKIVVALTMVGFACIISLMLFVFALDLGFIPRNL